MTRGDTALSSTIYTIYILLAAKPLESSRGMRIVEFHNHLHYNFLYLYLAQHTTYIWKKFDWILLYCNKLALAMIKLLDIQSLPNSQPQKLPNHLQELPKNNISCRVNNLFSNSGIVYVRAASLWSRSLCM